MIYIIKLMFIFALCSTSGWVFEVIFRSARHGKFVNPGFLSGCCLPIYGFGGVALFMLCRLLDRIDGVPYRLTAVFICGVIVMTAIELIGGLIMYKLYNMRLWDYSNIKGNFKGFICPRFSALWGFICLAFYVLMYHRISVMSEKVVLSAGMILFIGFYYGIFAVDLAESFDIASSVKKYTAVIRRTVNYEHLKSIVAEYRNKSFIILPNKALREYLTEKTDAARAKANKFIEEAEKKLKIGKKK